MSHYAVVTYNNDGVDIHGIFDTFEDALKYALDRNFHTIQRWDRDVMSLPA